MEKSKNKKRLVLLDAQAILHRAYHALPDFSSSKGEPTGALYGLSLMLLKIISELEPNYIISCYDVKEPTYRHAAYEGYKAKRKKADEALIAQIDRSKEVFNAFGIPIYEKAGYEADDLLGTIAEILKENKDVEIVIASGDMDTLQLAEGERVKVYTLKKGIKDTIVYDEEEVKKRFGFAPELLPDYKGLRGDPSDNIIGVKGIGEKTATDLIKNFGGIEEIYKELKKDPEKFEEVGIKKRIVELLQTNEEEALFSKTLATIKRDVPIVFNLPQKDWSYEENKPNILDIFSQLEFRALRERVSLEGAPKEPETGKLLVETEKVSDEDLRKTSIALWILDSNLTNPGLEDILRFAETRKFSEAKKIIFDALKKQGLDKIFKEIEEPLMPVIDLMEKRGVKIDPEIGRASCRERV